MVLTIDELLNVSGMSGKSLLTPAEAGVVLNVKTERVREMVRSGKLPAMRYSRKAIRIPIQAIKGMLEESYVLNTPVCDP